MDEFKKAISSKELLIALTSSIFTCVIGGVSWYNNKNYTDTNQDRYISELRQDVVELKASKASTTVSIALINQSLQTVVDSQKNIEQKIDILMERK